MKILVQNLGKSYNFDWIFRGLDYEFSGRKSYAVTGPNGSGKSTLLQVIAGIIPETEGTHYYDVTKPVEPENYFSYISFASPYMELFEELTLKEHLTFHFRLKKSLGGLSINEVAQKMYLERSVNKQIKNFSSGMKQRLKLGLALFSDVPVTFLDEPTSNMDDQGKQWYQDNINQIIDQRILIVASNNPEEYRFCTKHIHIPDFQ